MTLEDRRELQTLEVRLRLILPKEYQESYEDLQPVPMRSAGLKYRSDGRVAWDEIWGSFCDLAMAGGPPHKGTLLEPGRAADVAAEPDKYDEVAEEICRGVRMTADIDAEPSPIPGWVRVLCLSEGMSGWLVRAIAMENVAVRVEGKNLDVPAAPHFRLEKEIKNVVTVIAKTCHYWLGHMPRTQQQAIAGLFARMAADAPLIEPALSSDGAPDAPQQALAVRIADGVREAGLQPSIHRYAGWLGLECGSARAAIWMMRALVVSNILSRREGSVLFVPVNPAVDPAGERVVRTIACVARLAAAKQIG